MKRLILLALTAFSFACSQSSDSSGPLGREQQQAVPVPPGCARTAKNVAVCTYIGASAKTDRPSVIYYFHGIEGNPDLSVGPIANFIRANAAVLGCKMPSIVGLSLGKRGVFTSDNIRAVQEAIDDFEMKNFGTTPAERHLIGISMGGHNSLRLLMSDPDRFKTSTLLCPAIADFDAFEPNAEQAYIDRNRAVLDMNYFPVAWSVFEQNFPNANYWEQNNPMSALRKGRFDDVSFFISTGRQDSLGFFEGSQHFVDEANRRHMRVEWKPVNGPHCVFDEKAAASFLTSQFASCKR